MRLPRKPFWHGSRPCGLDYPSDPIASYSNRVRAQPVRGDGPSRYFSTNKPFFMSICGLQREMHYTLDHGAFYSRPVCFCYSLMCIRVPLVIRIVVV